MYTSTHYIKTPLQLMLLLLTILSVTYSKTPRHRAPIITKDGTVIAISDNPKRMRVFPEERSFTPILGYVRSDQKGRKGLECYVNKYLGNGYEMHLTIDSALQRKIETLLDEAKEKYEADEIIAAVMRSRSGEILAMASSNRYDPNHITMKDVSALNPKFAEYPYEPGSVIKPLTLAIALDHKLLTPDTFFKTYNGTLKVGGNRSVVDNEKFPALSAIDIIVHSSNVGISQISWLLTGEEFREGLLRFGLSSPSGIDLSRDLPGKIKPVELLNNRMHRANTAYGYGLHATFTQLLKAYSAFNNGGTAVVPHMIDYFTDDKGHRYLLPPAAKNQKAISEETAEQIHKILIEVVTRGTGRNAHVPGIEIGGKTGTAHIASLKRNPGAFHGSFYGFANDDEGHRYTIGVLVIKAKKENTHFASQSAVPVFREIMVEMVKEGLLQRSGDAQ